MSGIKEYYKLLINDMNAKIVLSTKNYHAMKLVDFNNSIEYYQPVYGYVQKISFFPLGCCH